jgi:hypothetical protein
MRVHPLAPVIGLDIDGTIGDYYNHFVWFLNKIYFPDRHHSVHWRQSKDAEFSEALGMAKEEYRAAKLAYRLGGLKRCQPTLSGVSETREAIQKIRRSGIQVWICTTRPWLSLTTVDPDTQYWLEQNVGRVDGLIYGEDKYADLLDIVGKDRVLGVIDDLPENMVRASELGIKCAIRSGPHNAIWRRQQLVSPLEFTSIDQLPLIIGDWIK